MSEWRRGWEVKILYDRPQGLTGTTKYSTVVYTVAELRQLVEAARADPNAWHIRQRPVRMLVGDRPHRCPRGHDLDGGSATRARVDSLDCDCGGHLLQICQCGIVVIDPAPGGDCEPRLRAGQRLPAAWRQAGGRRL